MQQHEEPSSENSLPARQHSASQTRVTPEELTAAITRLEAQKDTDQQRLQATIAIGEAVQQLCLEATPEEVLAEVQAARKRKSEQRKTRLSPQQRLTLWLAAGGLAVFLAVLQMGNQMAGSPNFNMTTVSTTSFVPNNNNPLVHILLDPNLLVDTASDKLVMLSEVGDDQPVRCFYSDGSFQAFQPGSGGQAWTLIKHSGKVYVHGWMHKMSSKVLQANGADIAPNQSPDFSVPVTLPVSGFQIMPGVGSNMEFHALNIHLDKYAYEKWQP